MLDIITADDLLPLVGSPAFIPAVISYIRNSSPGTLPLEPAIFQAVLLCVIAGDKHLILHTPEEDVGLVVRLAVWILSSIFDLPTQRVKMKLRHTPTPRSAATAPPPDPSIFLRSLFLHLNRNETFEHSRPLSRSRSKKSTRSDYRRSPSFANDLTSLAKSSSLTSRANPSAEHYTESSTSDTTVDVRQANTTFPIASPIPRPFLDAHLEPGPVRHDPTQPEFPHAIVMSGLEHASVQEQRSLARVLAERQVILEPISSEEGLNVSERHEKLDFDGTWNVPEGFIAVYVSPWNARERPNIHKTLLDQFAMSSNIFVQQNVRQALRTLSFLNPITHTRLHSHSHSNPPTPSPLQAMPLPQSRTPPMNARTLPGSAQPRHSQSAAPPLVPKQLLPKTFLRSLQVAAQRTHLSPTLSLYLADLFSAARHHPQLDGTFLTARAMNDAEALVRAERVIGTDPTGGELLRHHDAQLSYDESIENDMGQKSLHDYDDIGSGSITLNIAHDVALIHPSTSDMHQHAPTEVSDNVVPSLYVSEADIARIVPRVVTHRLRVRDGPEDEVLGSAMFGATFDAANVVAVGNGDAGHGWDTRSTVKDILIEILAEV